MPKKKATSAEETINALNAMTPDEKIQVLNGLVSRAQLASRMGFQYGDDRNLTQALGYKANPEYEDYAVKYARLDIAKAVIDRPINSTWDGGLDVQEVREIGDKRTDKTKFEKEWGELNKELSLVSKFVRLDKLTGIGCYGVLLLLLDDAKQSSELKNPVIGSNVNLVKVKPFGQNHAMIKTWEKNPSSPRFNEPLIYELTVTNPSDESTTSKSIQVHYTRIIHVADGLMESETVGTPRLEAILNRLYDLEKIVGGSAEMFWRGARNWFQGKISEDADDLTAAQRAALQDQFDEITNNLRRYIITKDIDIDSIDQNISDPGPHVEVQLQMISAEKNIPKRILTGTERGELASTQDAQSWKEATKSRRDNFAEPVIVRVFIDRCIELKVLSVPAEEYEVIWSDLWAKSEKEQAERGRVIAEALKFWASDPTITESIPLEAFLTIVMGIDDNDVEMINSFKKAAVDEEIDDFEGEGE